VPLSNARRRLYPLHIQWIYCSSRRCLSTYDHERDKEYWAFRALCHTCRSLRSAEVSSWVLVTAGEDPLLYVFVFAFAFYPFFGFVKDCGLSMLGVEAGGLWGLTWEEKREREREGKQVVAALMRRH